MSQIQINIPEDTTKKLKILALQSDRPLKKFIPLYLNKVVDNNLITVDERTGELVLTLPQSSPSLSLPTEITEINGRKIKSITYERSTSTSASASSTPTLAQLQAQQKKQKQKLYAYFKKKFKSVYSSYMPTPDTLPVCFRPAAMDYLLTRYPDNLSIDNYIDTQLDGVDFDNPDYEFYDYERYIEEREKKLIIPVEENYIYYITKQYCLEHDLSDVLYHIIEYDYVIYDNILYFTELKGQESFLYNILQPFPTEQELVDAFTWQDK